MQKDGAQIIYVTHCTRTKEERYKGTKEAVTPDLLYTARPAQRFMAKWFPEVSQGWYEKDPATVTEAEFVALLHDFDEKLSSYSEICFYYNPGRFNRLYIRLLRESMLADRVRKITHLWEIA